MRTILNNVSRIFIAVLVFASYSTTAQVVNTARQYFSPHLKPESNDRVLIIKDESALTRQQMLNSLTSGSVGLAPSHITFRLVKEHTDELGFLHSNYQVMVNNVPVENSHLKFHEKNGRLRAASLPALNLPSVSTTASIQSGVATGVAHSEITKFSVSDSAAEKLAQTSLVVINHNDAYTLTWKTEVFGKDIFDRYFAYVDASKGSIVRKVSRKINCAGTTPLPTLYNGNQNINYDVIPAYPAYHGLIDNCRPEGCSGTATTDIETYWFDGANVNYYFKPTAGAWATDVHHKTGYSVHWAMGKTYDYFRCTHGRDSYNNAAAPVVGVTHVGYDNAFWDGTLLAFGDAYPGGPFSGPLVSIDVVAHEFTHAVTEHTGGLIYESESGALNEAWSDIFGTVVEYYIEGASGNFEIGEDVTYVGSLRSMSNPNLRGQPDTYGGSYWQNVSGCIPSSGNDYCGVHTNSGVANYWFYLLVNGGSGTNDISNTYSVNGIGLDDAADIAYYAMLNYFTPTTTYSEARTYTILAAEDLFGVCSNQAVQTGKAWFAVGVGNDVLETRNVCGTYINGSTNVFRAVATLNSGSSSCGGTPVFINSGATVAFVSGININLEPGFTSEAGSDFVGEISACTPSTGISAFRQANSSFVGQGGTASSLSSIADVEADNLFTYPNPSSGAFSINSAKSGEVRITNAMGVELYQYAVTADQPKFVDLSNYAKGIYFVKFNNGNDIVTQKIIVE